MSDSDEVVPEKKGRGRPATEKVDKKRKADPEKDDAKPPAKKGRGRPKGAIKKTPAKKVEAKAKTSRKPKKKSETSGDDSEEESSS